ncbi:MAG: 30S ribosomal protein S7 [Flavobacteriales bacterium]|jgi:small subunit ribosomal protein S7|nr:30S ribosomal protein S7 [Flavobacteriales bacterium]
MRKGRAKKRVLLPDPKFNNTTITRFVNMIMLDGKKSTAFKIFYDAMEIVDQKSGDEENPVEVFQKALENATPHVEVRSKRVGGATFQVPMMIRPDRKTSMAMKWLIGFARKRNEKTMSLRLANEILAAYREEGATIKKKTDVHRMAEANKAFSNFRF